MERREEISSYYVKRKNPISTRSGRLFFLSKNDEILASEVQLFHYAVLKQVVENEKKEHISAMAKLSKMLVAKKNAARKSSIYYFFLWEKEKEHINAMAKLSKYVDSNKKGCPKEQPLFI